MANFIIDVNGMAEKLLQEFETLKNNTKRPNILILGRTGVGKSSLINCIFGKELAKVSDVKPQTKGFYYYTAENTPVSIIDSEGYELENSEEFSPILKEFVESSFKEIEKQVHLAWYCIAAPSARVLPFDLENIKTLIEQKIPVAVTITKCDLDDPDGSIAKSLSNVIVKEFGDSVKTFQTSNDEKVNESLDIESLITWSVENISEENLKRGFIIAQKASLECKESKAKSRVKYYAMGAATIGASPIPMSDAIALTALQVGMTADIFSIYGIDNSILGLAKNLIQTKLVSLLGKTVAGNLIKLIPGFGLAGSAINAAVATTITYSMGYALCILARKAIENEWTGNEIIENLFSTENFSKAFEEGEKEAKEKKINFGLWITH